MSQAVIAFDQPSVAYSLSRPAFPAGQNRTSLDALDSLVQASDMVALVASNCDRVHVTDSGVVSAVVQSQYVEESGVRHL